MAISNKDTDTFDWMYAEWLLDLDYKVGSYTFEEAVSELFWYKNEFIILNHRVIYSTLLEELYGRA
jgi:hypothetical protein